MTSNQGPTPQGRRIVVGDLGRDSRAATLSGYNYAGPSEKDDEDAPPRSRHCTTSRQDREVLPFGMSVISDRKVFSGTRSTQ